MGAPLEASALNAGAALVATIGGADFDACLLRLADEVAGVDEVFAYALELNGAPHPIVSRARSGHVGSRPELYVARFFQQDPLRTDLFATGAIRIARRIGAWDVVDPDYRRECFDRPRFGEKLCYAERDGQAWTVVSFHRGWERESAGVDVLASLAELALPILRRHAELTAETRLTPLARLSARLQRRHPDLSAREREVCVRTLLGSTAADIAQDLAIQPSTVLTYRRRAYERIGVSSAAQLVPSLLS